MPGPKPFATADALVVRDEITAAIEDELVPVDLERPGVVGGMPVDDINCTMVDQSMRKSSLRFSDSITLGAGVSAGTSRRWPVSFVASASLISM